VRSPEGRNYVATGGAAVAVHGGSAISDTTDEDAKWPPPQWGQERSVFRVLPDEVAISQVAESRAIAAAPTVEKVGAERRGL